MDTVSLFFVPFVAGFEIILTHAEGKEIKILTRSRKDAKKARMPDPLGGFASLRETNSGAGVGKGEGKEFLTG